MRKGDLVRNERGDFVGICMEDRIEAGTPIFISDNGVFSVKLDGSGISTGSIFAEEELNGLPILNLPPRTL